MYDRVNIRSVIIVTSLAAVISVAAGGIGGVPMGTLLIRALLFSLLFALGTVLVNIIVDTYLPELKLSSAGPDETEGENEENRGQNVNIVMDDGEEGSPVSYGQEQVDGEEDDSLGDGEGYPSRESVPVSEPAAGSSAFAQDREKGGSKALPDIGVFSSLGDDEDEPEDLDDGESATTSNISSGSGSSRYSAMQTNDEEKIEYFQNNTTAEELAKGVRTMLKSDEKG